MFKDLTLQFLYHSQSFAGGWNHQYRVRPKCTLRWQCCHILAFCAKERCAPFDYWTKRCDFCLYQYLSLWGIFRFCFWAVFLFSISQAFLSYLDKWRVLNDWFSFFYFLQLGGSHISVAVRGSGVGHCGWISDVLPSWLRRPYLFLLSFEFQLNLELWWGKQRVPVSHPLKMCCACCSISQVESRAVFCQVNSILNII